jgi:hypothetical protein
MLIVATVILLLLSNKLNARPTIGPPSIQLRSNLANIIVAEYQGSNEQGNLSFKKIKDLHNQEEAQSISINTNQNIADKLELGQSYIISYIKWKTGGDSRLRNVYKRPGGPIFQNLAGAQPAIYRYSEDIIQFITWDLDQSLLSPKEMLPALLRGIQNPDQQIQDFFITELMTRRNIHQWMNSDDYEKILNVLRSPLTPSQSKHFIISYKDIFLPHIDKQEYCTILNNIITYAPVNLDPNSFEPSLIRLALSGVSECGNLDNLNALKKWTLSNHNALIESALKTIQHLYPQKTKEIIDENLKQSLLLQSSKTVLRNYRKRIK